MVLIWLNIPFDILTQIAGFILANFSIALMMLAALYLNAKLPAVYRTRPFMFIGASIFSCGTYDICGNKRLGIVRQTVRWQLD